jgi:thioredoxin-like negative regulator of GroEL
MIKLLTLSNIAEFERITEQELSLIAFGTPWSSPCQNQHKILVHFMQRYCGSMAIARVDVEKHPGIARKGNIQTVPTLIVYRKGGEMKRLVGLQSLKTLRVLISAMTISDVHKNTAGGADARSPFLHSH